MEESLTTFPIYGSIVVNGGTDNGIPVAGATNVQFTPTFQARIIQLALSADVGTRNLMVGVPATTADKVTVSLKPSTHSTTALKTLTITGNKGTASTTTTGKWNWNGLVLSPDLVAKTVYIDGTPLVSEDMTCTVNATSDSGTVTSTSFAVSIAAATTYSMSLDPSSFTRVVSKDEGTMSGKVVIKQGATTATPTLTSLVISADSVPGATGTGTETVKWNGLTIGVSRTSPTSGTVGTVSVSGTPNALDSGKTFYLIAKSAAGSISNASFTVAVKAGSIIVTPTAKSYTVNTVVPAGDGVTVTSTLPLSTLTIKQDGVSGVGTGWTSWNDLTLTVDSTLNRVSIVGTPKTVGSQKFILTGTSGSNTMAADFTVTVSSSGGGGNIVNTTPTMYDDNGVKVTTMKLNELMTLIFGTRANLSSSSVSVYVSAPDGTAMPLSKLSTWTSGNGFVVDPANIIVYYTPTMNGDYKFTFSYIYNGITYTQTVSVRASGHRSGGSSGGCDAGFGMMALLTLGGLALLRKRED